MSQMQQGLPVLCLIFLPQFRGYIIYSTKMLFTNLLTKESQRIQMKYNGHIYMHIHLIFQKIFPYFYYMIIKHNLTDIATFQETHL